MITVEGVIRMIAGDPGLRVLLEVLGERTKQDQKWGEQNHPDGTGSDRRPLRLNFKLLAEMFRDRCEQNFANGEGAWSDILTEEFFEAMAEDDPVKLRAELIQVAAVAVSWVEDIDRR